MDCSMQSAILTAGQRAFLKAFFAGTDALYLTGGTALAGSAMQAVRGKMFFEEEC